MTGIRRAGAVWLSLLAFALVAAPATFANADAPASCAGQDSSAPATSLGSGFAGLVTQIAHTGTLGQFTSNEAHLPTDSCPF